MLWLLLLLPAVGAMWYELDTRFQYSWPQPRTTEMRLRMDTTVLEIEDHSENYEYGFKVDLFDPQNNPAGSIIVLRNPSKANWEYLLLGCSVNVRQFEQDVTSLHKPLIWSFRQGNGRSLIVKVNGNYISELHITASGCIETGPDYDTYWFSGLRPIAAVSVAVAVTHPYHPFRVPATEQWPDSTNLGIKFTETDDEMSSPRTQEPPQEEEFQDPGSGCRYTLTPDIRFTSRLNKMGKYRYPLKVAMKWCPKKRRCVAITCTTTGRKLCGLVSIPTKSEVSTDSKYLTYIKRPCYN